MTLIVAIPATDGVVFASDMQVTVGQVRTSLQKIEQLNDSVLWAASGELAIIQRFKETVEALPQKNQPLAAIRDDLGQLVKSAVNSLVAVDFRTQFFATDPDALLRLHPADFLFVEGRPNPRILHLVSNGTSEWIDYGFTATGSGELFAHALMTKYKGQALSREHAKLLAYKVIDEAIEVGSYGLGHPIDIWEASQQGCTQTATDEMDALQDVAAVLRTAEVMLLTQPSPPDDAAEGEPDEKRITTAPDAVEARQSSEKN